MSLWRGVRNWGVPVFVALGAVVKLELVVGLAKGTEPRHACVLKERELRWDGRVIVLVVVVAFEVDEVLDKGGVWKKVWLVLGELKDGFGVSALGPLESVPSRFSEVGRG